MRQICAYDFSYSIRKCDGMLVYKNTLKDLFSYDVTFVNSTASDWLQMIFF